MNEQGMLFTMPIVAESNRKSVFTTLGAANFRKHDRENNDFYATDPEAVVKLLKVEQFSKNVWECACGQGHISNVLKTYGYSVKSSDLVNRGYGEQIDFLKCNTENYDGDIITNPPFNEALNFIKRALNTIADGHKVAMFLKLNFLAGKQRGLFYRDTPPTRVYVLSNRVGCAMNGDFENWSQNAIDYAWYIWEKPGTNTCNLKWID